ncbi:TonB family C-terminal domain-containing protein [Marivirga sericea]|uniref:TonB family C-terminal domain-containing protein n=1 Tax=Marivirga sericea TaxID=1028 RepID=A0A1X7I2V3_9BACT|nr:M56 family metallopeptidase [Marivirga sericea]SMG08683.1 TonB family C-terminal domain-containing protein [Marivirga sericea]
METLIYVLKAHILFLILGGLYHFMLKNEKNFTFNRYYLLAIYGASILAPLLDFKLLNNVTIIDPQFFNSGSTATTAGDTSAALESNFLILENLLPWIYALLVSVSVIIFIIRFATSYNKFHLLQRISKLDYKRNVYWIEDDIPPFTFLNKTILPLKLQEDENQEVIIKHEEAHRKTFHFFDIIWVEILSSLLIFNPFHKKIKKYVMENHEFLADEYACEMTDKSHYAQILIHQTLNQNRLNFVSYFAKPTILSRLNMLKSSKKSKSKPVIVALSFILISALFSCDLNPTEEIILKKDSIKLTDKIPKAVDENTIFSIVENQAEPREGVQAFYDALNEDLKGNYPQEAIQNGIEGIVYIQFVIEKDGSLSNIQAVKGIGGGCDQVAVNMIKNYGDWIPGKQNGETVRSRRVVPVRFVLN